jgi:biopolymer transport protein ExbB/TolQ
MNKLPGFVRGIVMHPLLWGLLVTVGFYAALDAGLVTHPVALRYLSGHWAAYGCVALFFVGVSALVIKSLGLAEQLESLRLTLLDPIVPEKQSAATCKPLLDRLEKQPSRLQSTYLLQRLRAALRFVNQKGAADGLDDELRALADAAQAQKHAGYAIVRMMIWAIPFVGSLGTVIGIGQAVSMLSGDPAASPATGVTQGLELVFDTTALALGLSVVLMLVTFIGEQVESKILSAVDERAQLELLGRFKIEPAGGGGAPRDLRQGAPANLSEMLTQAVEKIAEKQAAMFQASMESANKQWEERAALLQKQLGSGSGGGPAVMHVDSGHGHAPPAPQANFSGGQADWFLPAEVMDGLSEAISMGSLNWPVRKSRGKAGAKNDAGDANVWLDRA